MTDPSPTVAHSARLWNYLLGGTDNFAVDRATAEEVLAYMPDLARSARSSRQFLGRAVRYLTGTAGVRQFLDLGTGLPSAGNTHEVAQAMLPAARVVYVDNDPLVLAHAQDLLTGTREGRTTYVDADLRDPGHIMAMAATTLDLTQPVAVMLLGSLNFVVDDAEAAAVVRHLLAAVPANSYLVISHPTMEVHPESIARAMETWNGSGSAPICARSPQEITAFFRGLDLLDPGIVTVSRWRPDGNDTTPVSEYGGVARKPSP